MINSDIKAALSPIIKCLNKSISIVYSSQYIDNNEFYFTFDNLHKMAVGKFMWKLHNDKLPTCIKNMFLEKAHRIVSRNNTRFQLPNPRTEYKRKFITFYGLKLWNSIPLLIKASSSIEIFKRKLKLSFEG